MSAELAKLQSGFATLSKQMQMSQISATHPDNVNTYKDQLAAINRLRDGYSQMKDGQLEVIPGFNQMVQATGMMTVETVKSMSATQNFTKALRDQKVSFGSVISDVGNFTKNLRAATQEQANLQKASALQWTSAGVGNKQSIDLYVPKNLGDALVDTRTKYGMLNYAIGQIAQNTINWGKNTQWAGRQLTAGISMPLAVAAAQLVSLSNQTDQALTKITKVYNTNTTPGADPVQQQISTQKQLSDVRQQSYQTGIDMAKQYGAALQETLGTEADLAAIGKTGMELQQSTAQVTRIATLGELDHATAMQMSISLMSAFKMNADQLGDAFNYMNAIENATSMTTQDFADSIPKAASSLASLGVNIQQFGVLMTAFKEGGVSADQGANALKSAMARILTPTAAARTEFANMKINIDEVVGAAKGNLFVILQQLSEKMKGFDEQTKLTALKDLFGTYQVNRLNVALNGIGDAMNGVSTEMSQTAEAVKIMEQGTGSWAQTADQEINQLNNSISMKFKKAVETFKAEWAQAGMPILSVLTNIINFVDTLLNKFNNAPAFFKNTVGWGLAIAAILGPVVMLVGLFANWWGNIGKLTTAFGNLFLKFKPLTTEQAANEAIARLSAQSYDIQAQSAGILAGKISALTQAMLIQQRVQGAALGLNATQLAAIGIGTPGTTPTTPTATTGTPTAPVAGTKAATGAATGGGETAANNEAVANSAEAAAKSTEKLTNAVTESAAATEAAKDPLEQYNQRTYDLGDAAEHAANKGRAAGETFRMVFSTLTAASVGIMGLKELASGTASWGEQILNVSLILGALEAGGVFKGLKAGMGDLVNGTANVAGKFKSLWTAALSAVSVGVKGLAAAFKMLFLTPWGIALMGIAAIAFALYELNKKQDGLATAQDKINASTQTWADILGFTNKNLQLNANNLDKIVGSSEALASVVSKMPQDLKDAYAQFGKLGDGYETLYQKAKNSGLQQIVEGASPAQAAELVAAAMQAGGAPSAEIPDFVVRFKKISLDDPAAVQKELMDAVDKSMQDASGHFFAGQYGDWWKAWYSNNAGFTDEAKSAVTDAATNMTEALKSASADKDQMYAIGQNWLKNWDGMWTNTFSEMQDKSKGLFAQMGIKNMDDLQKAFNDAQNGKGGADGKKLLDFMTNQYPEFEGVMDQYKKAYTSALEVIGKARGLDGQGLKDWISQQTGMAGALNAVGTPIETASEALDHYNRKLADYQASNDGKQLSDDQKLVAMNIERVAMGLPPATSLLEGFTDATKKSGAEAEAASGHFLNMANALNTDWAMNNLTGSEYSSMMKDGMKGAQDWMYNQFSKAADKAEKRIEKGITDAGKKTVDGLKKQEKAVNASYDAMEKAQKKSEDASKKAITDKYKDLSDGYDKDIKQAKDAAKAKTDAINDEIKALQKDDTTRQKLFQNEQTRIERLSQMQNNNIDLNSALNSGNIDEAARVMANANSQATGWMLSDHQQAMDDASKAQQDTLQAQIDATNASTDAYTQSIQDKKDALDQLKEDELAALDVVNQAQEDALAKRKQDALDALQASEDAVNTDTQNRLQKQQDWYSDAKDKIDLINAANAAIVPTNAAELQQMSADTKKNYGALGLALDGITGGFSGDLGHAIEENILRAQNAVADAKKWQQLGQFIDDQIAGTTGFSLQTVLDYLKTGKWNDGPPKPATPAPNGNVTSGIYTDNSWIGPAFAPGTPLYGLVTSPNLANLGTVDWATVAKTYTSTHHAGGIAGVSPNSRGNIPWGSPLQPSETFALLQKGEFVVNKDATAQNMDLLHAINSGMPVRHDGGIIGGMTDAATYKILSTEMLKAALMQTGAEQAIVQASHKTPAPAVMATMGRFFTNLAGAGALAGAVAAGPVAGAPTDVSGNKKIVMDMAASQYGWSGKEWDALYALVMSESGFQNAIKNRSGSTAYGMFQFLDGTWAGYGVPKTSDATQQTIAGLKYIKARYGDPIKAWAFHRANNYYDNGGYLAPGATMAMNATGKPEPVFTDEQWRIMRQLVANSLVRMDSTGGNLASAINELTSSIDSGTSNQYNVTIDMTGANLNSQVDFEKGVLNALQKLDAKNGRSRVIS